MKEAFALHSTAEIREFSSLRKGWFKVGHVTVCVEDNKKTTYRMARPTGRSEVVMIYQKQGGEASLDLYSIRLLILCKEKD